MRHAVRSVIIASGMFGVALALATARPAAAQSPSYPWCASGSVYRCWYMTREQCEEAVHWHGFCVTDPNVPRHYGEKIRGEWQAPF
ncbi:MAG TPA: hypothetical protein VGJ20_43315 [Xanthobacteraceae bacterium]|jgi:hypothetical protein